MYPKPICIQGNSDGAGGNWTFNDDTPMSYFNWGPNEPKETALYIRMIQEEGVIWKALRNHFLCSYLCEKR